MTKDEAVAGLVEAATVILEMRKNNRRPEYGEFSDLQKAVDAYAAATAPTVPSEGALIEAALQYCAAERESLKMRDAESNMEAVGNVIRARERLLDVASGFVLPGGTGGGK